MSTFLRAFEFALNTTLKSDPETQEKLCAFDGRVIAITINDLNKTIFAVIDKTKIVLRSEYHQKVDLIITATMIHLLKLVQNPEHLFSSDINIHGDVQFAKQLQDLLQSFDFDWEAHIAKVTGDTLSYPIAHLLRQTTTWVSNTNQSLQQTTAEYLREEIRILPDKSQINTFMSEVDKLRADLDRLEARIHRLQS